MIHEIKSQFKSKGDWVKKGQEVDGSSNLNLTNRHMYLTVQHEPTKCTFFKINTFIKFFFSVFDLKNWKNCAFQVA